MTYYEKLLLIHMIFLSLFLLKYYNIAQSNLNKIKNEILFDLKY